MTFTGYIYKLTGACGKVYIGSTVDFQNRKYGHNCKANDCNSRLLLKPIVDEIIDTREYILTKTLRLVEQFYLDNINNINCRRAYTNHKKASKKYQKQYRERNIVKIKEYQNQYYEENKEKKRENNKKYYEENKEKETERNRKYKEENRVKYKEYHKNYFQENKEKIREQQKEKVKCECGGVVRKDSLHRHRKSKKHLKLIRI